MALQLRRGHASSFTKTVTASFAVLALVAQPFYAVIASQTASAAANGDVIVRADNTQGWSSADTTAGGAQSFVTDAGAPYGNGALNMTTSAATTAKSRYSKVANFVKLSDVKTGLSYNTKQISASFSAGLPAFQLETYLGGFPNGYTTLTYEPYVSEGNAAVQNNVWQSWDVSAGKFYSSRAVGSLQASQGSSKYTLDQIISEFPNAQVYKVGVNVGSNNPSYNVLTDGIKFNGTVYDFEPAVPPATPSNLRLNGDKPCGYITNINSITPTWDAVPGATSYNYKVTLPNGSTYGPANVGNVTSVTGAFGGEGLSTFSVQAVGATGALSDWAESCAVTYDKTAPSVPINGQPRDGAYKTTNDFYFTWNASAGASTYEFQSSGSSAVDGNGSLVGSWNSITNGNSEQSNLTTPQIHSTGAPDGHYYWQVRAIDAAGNKSAWSTVWDMRIDQKPAAPVFTVDGLSSGDTTNSYSITARWNKPNADVVKYEYQYWNNIVGNPYKEATPYSVELTSESSNGVFNQGEGTHYMRVIAIDAIGTRSDPSNVFVLTYDKTNPVVTLSDIAPVTTGQNSVIKGTVSDATATQVQLYIDGALSGTTNVANGEYSFELPLSQGSHQVYAKAIDAANNPSENSDTKTAAVNAAPTEGDGDTDGEDGGDGDGEGTGTPIIPVVTTPNTDGTPADEDSSDNDDGEVPTVPQVFTAPIVALGDQAVLGDEDATTDTPVSDNVASDQDVKGTSDDKKDAAFSLAWYWWLAILAAIIALWLLIAAALRRRKAEN